MSDFAALNIALTGLYAQRRGLEITGHNVANANTDGYSRQRVDLQSVSSAASATFFSRAQNTGQGVQVAGYTRFRDAFLEIRATLEHGAHASLSQLRGALSNLEGLFGEPGDQSIAKGLSDYWAGWDDVANHPSDNASRAQLLERAGTLAGIFNHASQQLTQFRTDATSQLGAVIDTVNVDAANVAKLNDAIRSASTAGLNVNDLLDQRDKLVQKLATEVGATVRPSQFGQVNVFVGGTALVTDDRAETLALDTVGPTPTIRWTRDNYAATVNTGDAGGLLQVINVKVPAYQSQLDNVALKLRDDVNAMHAAMGGAIATAAQDQSGSGNLQFQIALNGGAFATATVAGADWSGAGGAAALQASLQAAVNTAVGAGNATVVVSGGAGQSLAVSITPTGRNALQVQAVGGNAGFSTLIGATAVGLDGIGGRKFFDGTGAADLAVSTDIGANTDAVAAGASGSGALDGSVALGLAEMGDSQSGADSLYRSLIVGLGVDSQNAQRNFDIQSATVDQVDGARQSASGVNTDEEMVAMVQYQHAYEAAARFLTAVDSMLDTLVNRTGVR